MSALNPLLRDLQRLGFGDEHTPINGGDTVDVVNAHYDTLRQVVAGYDRLHDLLSDLIEGGRLKEADIPDDYQAIVEQLALLANPPTDPVPSLADRFGGYWSGEHPDYPVEDWQGECANDDTRLGYWEWAQGKLDSDGGEQEARDA